MAHFGKKLSVTGLPHGELGRTSIVKIYHSALLFSIFLFPLFLPDIVMGQSMEELKAGVVKIHSEYEGTRQVGTGIIVQLEENAVFILTAAHVIVGGDPHPEVFFKTRSNRPFPSNLVKADQDLDLALLLVEGPLPKDLRMMRLDPFTKIVGGEKVTIIGFPRIAETSWTVTAGTVAGLNPSSLVFSGTVAEGNSGGPLLLDGKVIGVVSRMDLKFGYAVPAALVQRALDVWNIMPPLGKTEISDEALMVLISAGEFWMGSPEDESRSKDERPRHKVFLDSFYLDTFEVTTEQYAQFMSSKSHTPPEFWDQVDLSRDKNKPVVGVSWQDANDFCVWAGKRLPTEAEWERAARGTDERKYPWGQEPPSTHIANFDQKPTPEKVYSDRLKPVGSYENGKSPQGVYDMAGNVWEWVGDWYDKKYYRVSPKKNPKGPERGEEKVMRGGSWDDHPSPLRSSDRSKLLPSERNDSVGFRCAKDVR